MSEYEADSNNSDDDPARDVDYALVEEIRTGVNAKLEEYENSQGKLNAKDLRELAKNLIMRDLGDRALKTVMAGARGLTAREEVELSNAVVARMFGMGRLENLFEMTHAEDFYIHGNSPVIVKYFGGGQGVLPPVAESDEDLRAQVQAIATHHGQDERTITTAQPFLNLELPGKDARLGYMWGVTPHPVVTIRRHRFVNVNLEDLVQYGTISRPMMALLQAAVMGRKSILIVGSQGAGKTTALRALCACIPPEERFATMETEFELLLHTIPGRYPLLIPVQERMGNGDKDATGRPVGEITLGDIFPWMLRHTAKRIIIGEVRSEEVLPLMRAMQRGLRGSMATFHCDSARDTFESLASLLSDYRPALSREAAMRQIASALDFIVFIDQEEGIDPETGEPTELRFVSEILEVGNLTTDSGVPNSTFLFGPHKDPEVRKNDPRGYPTGTGLSDGLWAQRAGLDPEWLTNTELGVWDRPFLQRLLA